MNGSSEKTSKPNRQSAWKRNLVIFLALIVSLALVLNPSEEKHQQTFSLLKTDSKIKANILIQRCLTDMETELEYHSSYVWSWTTYECDGETTVITVGYNGYCAVMPGAASAISKHFIKQISNGN